MSTRPVRLALLALVAAAAVLVAGAHTGAAGPPAHAQLPQTRIGIDADTQGNQATSLGSREQCAEISVGDTHDIDIYVMDVTDLLAWEAVIVFAPGILEVVDEDATLFLGANEGSDVLPVSGELPDGDGRYQVGAVDTADPPAPDSGSGVLARVTVRGVAPGVSDLRLPQSDFDGDGQFDEGPLLQDIDVNHIGDENDDTLFDGEVTDARIAVGASCSDEPASGAPETGPPDSAEEVVNEDEDDLDVLTVVVIVAGLGASVAVGAVAAGWAVRRHRGAAKE